MAELRRRFTIDDTLGRFSKALKNLYEMGPGSFEETRKYAAEKELYSEALGLYKYEEVHLRVEGLTNVNPKSLMEATGYHARLCKVPVQLGSTSRGWIW